MNRLTLLLLLTASVSSCTILAVLTDRSLCVNLRCEFRGVGEHCKPATIGQANQQKTVPDARPISHYSYTNDTETSILARIQAEYPVNTFTVVNDFQMGEHCDGRRLWCNDFFLYFARDYKDFVKLLKEEEFPPKLQC